MKRIQHLDIIENWYQVVNWYIEPLNDPCKVYSDISLFQGMNELQDYRNSGVYSKADVPYSISCVNPEKYEVEPYLAFAQAYSDLVFESVRQGNVQLCVGSYCTHIPSILGGIRRALGADKKIGLIWLDAHADNCIPEQQIHHKIRLIGVPMAVLSGQTMPQWQLKCGLIPPISGEHILASDIRCFDSETEHNITQIGAHVVPQESFRNHKVWVQKIAAFVRETDAVFLHVDADILHHDYLPAYEYDVINGNSLETVQENIKVIMETGKVIGASVMCIGFENQPDRLRDVNNMNGIRLVSSILSNWKYQPEV